MSDLEEDSLQKENENQHQDGDKEEKISKHVAEVYQENKKSKNQKTRKSESQRYYPHL